MFLPRTFPLVSVVLCVLILFNCLILCLIANSFFIGMCNLVDGSIVAANGKKRIASTFVDYPFPGFTECDDSVSP